jgi:hypothetical protein
MSFNAWTLTRKLDNVSKMARTGVWGLWLLVLGSTWN